MKFVDYLKKIALNDDASITSENVLQWQAHHPELMQGLRQVYADMTHALVENQMTQDEFDNLLQGEALCAQIAQKLGKDTLEKAEADAIDLLKNALVFI